jgi:mono/diheme cytochrome c family protein
LRTYGRQSMWIAATTLMAFAFAVTLAAVAGRAQGAKSQRTVWDGVYTEAQAQRGQAAYKQSCEGCHSDDLRGRGNAPSLIEESFAFQWGDLSVGDLRAKTQLMPSDRPGSLPLQAYIDIIAFVLQKNEMPAGQQELGIDVTTLKQIFITAKPAGK